MTALYIDVSHHDRNRRGAPLDWAAIAAAGLADVMCARVTYGDPGGWHRSTSYAAEMLAGAKAAGYAARGGYHNLVRGDDASIARQVDWLRRTLDENAGTWAMCDVEAYQELQDAQLVPRWSDVARFHDRWYALESRVCAWYLPRWFYRAWLGGTPDLRYLHGPLVQSNYPGGDGTAQEIYIKSGGDQGTGWDDLYGNRLPDIWQYTWAGNVPGASESTDCNAYRGTATELVTLLNGDDMPTVEEIWGTELYRDWVPDADGTRPARTMAQFVLYARRDAYYARAEQVLMQAKLDVIQAAVTGDIPDLAPVLAALDERLAALRTQVEAEVRDAVADLGEGGAAQVRADA